MKLIDTMVKPYIIMVQRMYDMIFGFFGKFFKISTGSNRVDREMMISLMKEKIRAGHVSNIADIEEDECDE